MTENAPILIVNTEADLPVKVKEQLRVYENGRSYLHVQAAADANQRNQAGTYMAQLDKSGLETVQRIVDELLALPPQADGTFPDGIRSSVTVSKGDASQSHLLPSQILASTPPILVQTAQEVKKLMAHVYSTPLAVMGLRAKVKSMSGKPPMLLLTCVSLGNEPVRFLFRPESLSVLADSSQGMVPIWQNSLPEQSGLIDGSGKLVDGVYTAATLMPGSSATAVYNQTSPAIQATMQLQVEGWIELHEEDDKTAVTPQAPIWLVTQLTE